MSDDLASFMAAKISAAKARAASDPEFRKELRRRERDAQKLQAMIDGGKRTQSPGDATAGKRRLRVVGAEGVIE